QIALVESFANQAVIAIENVRLFTETKESLERQTAISEVLKTISRTAFDIRPTLRTVIENAARLSDADGAWMTQRAGQDTYMGGEIYGRTPELQLRLDRGPTNASGWVTTFEGNSLMERTYREERAINIPDVESEPALLTASATIRAFGTRSAVSVPIRTDQGVVGVMILARIAVRPFSEREVQLIETFADQAAIAIQNARLFT